jgi:chromosome partitioning protein
LAVAAEAHGERVLILDVDPQGSSLLWSKARGAGKPPIVVDVAPEKLSDVLGAAATLNASLVVVDTPSRLDGYITAAVRVSSLVILPAKPGLLALAPLQETVKLVETAGKKHVAVGCVNDVELTATGAAKAEDVVAVLKGLEIAVAPTIVHHLGQFGAAFDRGLAVGELRPAGRAAAEIEALWLDLEKLARRLAAPSRKREARA